MKHLFTILFLLLAWAVLSSPVQAQRYAITFSDKGEPKLITTENNGSNAKSGARLAANQCIDIVGARVLSQTVCAGTGPIFGAIFGFDIVNNFTSNDLVTLEISDGSGNFDNATEVIPPMSIYTFAGELIRVNLPVNLPLGANYKIRIRITNRDCVSNELGPLTILPAPQNVTLTSSGTLTCTKTSVQLTAGGGLDGATYQYSAGATNNGATATVTNYGPYSVTVTNPGGCTATANTTVSSNTTAPTATLSNNGPITCNQRTVTLTAGGDGTYAFSSGASQVNGGNTATVINDGPYSVTVTSANGCTAVQTTQVSSNTTTPTATLNNNGSITCNQRTVTLTAGGGGTYAFSPGASANGNTATVTNDGLYSVTVTSANGCTATQTTQVASNTIAPTASLINNGPITCAQRIVTLTAGGGGTYAFSTGANQVNGGNTATVTNDGPYSVTVTNPANGCTAIQTTQVNSNTAAPTATLSNNGPITCNQRTVILTAGGGGSYAFSAGATPTGNTATVTAEGTYTVTVTNATNGCSSFTTTTVSSNTTAPNATLSNNGPITASQPTVTLTAGGGNTYQFSPGAAQQGGGNTAMVSSPGPYQVTVTTSSNGCSATASTTVTGAVSGSSCRNGSGVINVVATGTPVKYEWYRNSINSARLTENPAQVKGTSTASLTLVNQQVTADYYVRVTDANGSAVVYGPFRFTVNTGCNIYARQGAEEVELRISLLGNPIQGDQLKAVISGAQGQALSVQLLDLSGKPIRAQQWGQAEGNQALDWSLSAQASGVYLLQATTPDQRQSLKVIKP